jgi:hypothetical protein
MKIMSKNLASHEVTLESFLYPRIILVSGYHDMWVLYIRDKDKGEA